MTMTTTPHAHSHSLTLSQAIRKGCMMDPRQATGHMTLIMDGQEVLDDPVELDAMAIDTVVAEKYSIATCAFGAAYRGITGKYCMRMCQTMRKAIIEATGIDVYDIHADCPIPNALKYKPSISNIVLYLNDVAQWSREQIADWLESIGY